LRPADDLSDDARDDEFGNLANNDKDDRDGKGLKIHIRAQQLGPGLGLFEERSQRK